MVSESGSALFRPAVSRSLPAAPVIVNIETLNNVLAEILHELPRDSPAGQCRKAQRLRGRLGVDHVGKFAAPSLGTCRADVPCHTEASLLRTACPTAAS